MDSPYSTVGWQSNAMVVGSCPSFGIYIVFEWCLFYLQRKGGHWLWPQKQGEDKFIVM